MQRSTGSDAHLVIGELSYHGHRENDLVRFPDPTNVLKYPHVAMTGPAQRGYVATSASNTHTGGTTINYNSVYPQNVTTDDIVSNYFGLYDNGTNSPYVTTTGYWDTTNYPDLKLSSASGTPAGDWVAIEMPRKIILGYIELAARNASLSGWFLGESARDFEIWATNDSTSWTRIHQTIDAPAPVAINTVRTFQINATTAYKKFALIITRNGSTYSGATGRPVITLGRWHLYGTEPEDVVARIGDGYDGKVRNLRVYSTALSQDRVQEIFDADKDAFGLAKSSVSVYRGHLGVGTTEPKAALTVMDEVGELEEFPPRAMTDYETYMEGHGVFRVSDTGSYNNSYPAWFLFNHTIAGAKSWYSLNGTYYNGTDNSYSGTAQMTPSSPLGDYIKLELPYRVKAKAFLMYGPNYENEYPRDYTFYGSNDGELWTNILSVTGAIVGTSSGVSGSGTGDHNKHEVDSSTFFKYFAIIITKGSTARNTYVGIDEWRILGTREQGASTLHNGELTLTRNLTVPRIGPALDADDTPRRDRLVVEYNTSTNPTENGVVKDTSGRGLDGIMYNDASYDATEKALVFDGTDDYIKVDDTGIRGDYIHSVSFWIYNDNYNINPFWIGENLGGKRINVYITASQIDYSFRGDTVTTTLVPPINRWWHLTLTYNGTQGINGRKIYIDGVEQTTTHSGTAAALNIVYGVMYLGTNFQQASDLNGKMSNFKLYDMTLTADEVKRLYDMGRCDEGHHVVNFSKTRVGIGLGDGEVPQAALDVRGTCILSKGYIGEPYNGESATRTGELVIKQSGDVGDGSVGIRMFRASNDTNSWHFGVNSSTNFEFQYNNSSMGYLGRTDVSVIDFTGQHRSFVDGVSYTEYDNLEGLIVSANKNKYYDINEDLATGANAIQISQSLPLVSLSTKEKDKACFGVISGSEDPESREYVQGSFVSVVQKQKGDTRAFINSVGEGAIWVTDINGPLESGDYITTSNVAGYGQKQDGAGLMNYTVAKITMDCDFEPATQPIQRIKRSNVVETHYTGLVPVIKSVPHEFVTTVVGSDDAWSNVSISPSDVTYAEWSNLEANVQNTYTLTYTQTSNVIYDVKYTKTTTANVGAGDPWDTVHIEPPTVTYAEYSNLEANIQNTYTLTYTMTTKVEATEAIYSNLSAEDKEFFMPTYYHMVEQIVDAEYPDAVKHETVTTELENDLDEHGQLQWEDTEDTEKAYKIRYLTADGTQTDQANAVHTAAFVGCTYHCG